MASNAATAIPQVMQYARTFRTAASALFILGSFACTTVVLGQDEPTPAETNTLPPDAATLPTDGPDEWTQDQHDAQLHRYRLASMARHYNDSDSNGTPTRRAFVSSHASLRVCVNFAPGDEFLTVK